MFTEPGVTTAVSLSIDTVRGRPRLAETVVDQYKTELINPTKP